MYFLGLLTTVNALMDIRQISFLLLGESSIIIHQWGKAARIVLPWGKFVLLT